MKEQNVKDEVTKILQEVPNARRALLQNYDNLLNVADYCYNNYLQSGESSGRALEETQNFATQSLASVAYQISVLANSVLSLLDAQTNQLGHMQSSINLIGQMVEMHKEKVSRREIGVFTAVRRVNRGHKILPPVLAGTQPRPPYSRKPINYQQLDSLGHGMKVSGKQAERSGMMRKHGGTIRSKPPEPVQCPVVPLLSSSSFGKPVAPPTAPTVLPECDIITTLLEDAPPLPLLGRDDEVTDNSAPPPPPPPPDTSVEAMAPPSPPPPPPDTSVEAVAPPSPPPPPLDTSVGIVAPPPPPPTLTNHTAAPTTPPLSLETVVEEENGFPPPSTPPPPPPHDDIFPSSANECQELPAPPPPPPPVSQEVEDLEIPAPPPPLLLDDMGVFDDIMTSLPPPVDYDTDAPPQYLEKVTALYSYEASKPDELSFTRGDVIYLTRRRGDGWWEGVVNGNRGFFPQNYVQSST